MTKTFYEKRQFKLHGMEPTLRIILILIEFSQWKPLNLGLRPRYKT